MDLKVFDWNGDFFVPFLTNLFLFFRVLTLWFDYGHWPEVNEALVEGVKAIQIDTWLQVRNTKA